MGDAAAWSPLMFEAVKRVAPLPLFDRCPLIYTGDSGPEVLIASTERVGAKDSRELVPDSGGKWDSWKHAKFEMRSCSSNLCSKPLSPCSLRHSISLFVSTIYHGLDTSVAAVLFAQLLYVL